MVLVYHRIGALQSPGLIPTVPVTDFRTHLQTLQDIGEIVPLSQLLRERRSTKMRFALTFDDDHAAHVDVVLPILLEHRAHATFFLSGRSLHELGPYWFQALENLVLDRGVRAVADLLSIAQGDVNEIAVKCESAPLLQAKLEATHHGRAEIISEERLAMLSDAGMDIGFHTLHHRLLPLLGDAEIDRALREGRDELEAAIRTPTKLFAYPHGKADARVAARVRANGYDAAFTGMPHPITRRSDRFLLGRWEPGVVGASQLTVKATGRVVRPIAST
jgi:peptidoglycan/xylan/chitin deacetylase (PgdA/CDA1 family)